MAPDSGDDDAAALRERVRDLEQTVDDQQTTIDSSQEPTPSRRGVLAALTGVAGAGALGAYSQRGAAQAAGQVGTQSAPVDVEAYDLNVQGTADGLVQNPLGGDLDAGGNSVTNVGAMDGTDLQYNEVNSPKILTGTNPERPLVSQQARSVSIGTDYSTVQAALDDCPIFLQHEYEINLGGSNFAENIRIDGVYGMGDASDGDPEHLLTINGGGGNVDSIFVSGCLGKTTPKVQSLGVQTSDTPHTPETDYPVVVYGSLGVGFQDLTVQTGASMSGTPSTSVLFYEAEGQVRNSDLGAPASAAVKGKRNSKIVVDNCTAADANGISQAAKCEEGSTINFMDNSATGTIPDGGTGNVAGFAFGGTVLDDVNKQVRRPWDSGMHAYLSTDQSYLTADGWEEINIDATTRDIGAGTTGEFDSTGSPGGNGAFVAQNAGIYYVVVGVTFAALSGNLLRARASTDGSDKPVAATPEEFQAPSGGYQTLRGSGVMELSAGDAVYPEARNDSNDDTIKSGEGITELQVERLGNGVTR